MYQTHSYLFQEMAEFKHGDDLKTARARQLVRQAQSAKIRRPLYAPALSKIGDLLIALGIRLRHSHAATAPQKTISRSVTTR